VKNKAQPPSTGVVKITPQAWRALAVGCAGFSLISFNTTATNLAFVDIAADFTDASQATVSWIASIFFIGLASLLLVSGRLADRVGRRRVLRVGLGTFAIGATLSALAPSIWVLIGARLVAAAGGALVIPSSLAVVLPEFPRERHFTAIALWSATGPMASAIAPGVAAIILAVSSWRVLFLVSAPIAVLALFGGWNVLHESRAERRAGALDVVGVVIGTFAIASLVFAVSQGANLGWDSPVILGAFLVCVVSLPVFVRRCRRHPEPLLNLDAFCLRPVWVANLANFLLNIAGMATWLVWPLFFSRIWGYSKVATGLALMPGPVVSGIITSYGGRLSERYGHEPLVRWGSLVPIAAIGWPLLFLHEKPNYWLAAAPAIALFGAGWALTQPPLNSGVLSQVPPDKYGEVNASFNTVRNIAAALGIAIAVSILGDADRPDALAAYHRVFWAFVAAVVACWLVLFLIYPSAAHGDRREDPSPAAARRPVGPKAALRERST
jgi:EmrB/QacA subfamily drug resistance transporter